MLSPGTCGKMAISAINVRLPKPTTLIFKSLSVLTTTSFCPPELFIEPKLPLTDFTMVGIVFIKVMIPPAATAPAPICRIKAFPPRGYLWGLRL